LHRASSFAIAYRTSYLPNEILWGHRFYNTVMYDRGRYVVDCTTLNALQKDFCTPPKCMRDYERQERAKKGKKKKKSSSSSSSSGSSSSRQSSDGSEESSYELKPAITVRVVNGEVNPAFSADKLSQQTKVTFAAEGNGRDDKSNDGEEGPDEAEEAEKPSA